MEGAAADATFEKPSFTERTVGNYENRLRKFSSPERVFEYFSSVEIDKQFFMTRDDLARAVTPYTYRSGAPLASKNPKFNAKASVQKNPKDVAEEYLRLVRRLMLDTPHVTPDDVAALLQFREDHRVDFEMHGGPQRKKTFFDLVDADGNGLISYPEYMFFNTLLTSDVRTRLIGDDDDAPIFKHLFGELATETLSYEAFCAFRRDLKQEIMRIQISFPLCLDPAVLSALHSSLWMA
ncbi:hypothetical protein BBJ28_00001258 [Nothophytophthora sp. Chile5]|nr:hypothetical protein BBJ28_00001258 [Nothophytophthora sp. Chile5]